MRIRIGKIFSRRFPAFFRLHFDQIPCRPNYVSRTSRKRTSLKRPLFIANTHGDNNEHRAKKKKDLRQWVT